MSNFSLCSFLLIAFAVAVVLGQETGLTVDKLSIAQSIDDIVARARKGVEATALKTSLGSIQNLADSYLNERGAIVDGADIMELVGVKNNWQLTLSAFLEDPLVQEERKVRVGLFVLSGLSLAIRAVDNDTHVNILVAAVSFTAKSVGRSLSMGGILYNYNQVNMVFHEKRWTLSDIGKRDHINTVNVQKRHNVHRKHIVREDYSISGSVSGTLSGTASVGDNKGSGSVSGTASGSLSIGSSGISGSLSGSVSGSVSGSNSEGDSASVSGSASGSVSGSDSGGISGNASGSVSGGDSGTSATSEASSSSGGASGNTSGNASGSSSGTDSSGSSNSDSG